MKKILITLIFNFSFLFSFGNLLEDENIFFTESYEMYEAEERPESVVIVQSMKISDRDPALMRDEYSKNIISVVYETLFTINSQGEIKNSLVEDYKWLSERKLYLKLKKKVFFHDNTELTALDVKKSLEFLREKGVLRNIYSDITDIKVLSQNELVITISELDNTFLNTLTYKMSAVVKRADGKIYGTGRYKIKEIKGKDVIFENFEKYHGKQASLKELIYRWEIDEQKRIADIFNEAAGIALDIEGKSVEKAKRLGVLSEETVVLPSTNTATTVVLFGEQNDFSLEMKRAFEKAVPREADTFFPKSFLKPKLSKIDTSYSEKDLKKLVEKTNYKKELNFVILNTENNMKIAQEIKKSLKNAGINIKILPHQIEAYNAKIASKNFDIALYDIEIVNRDLVFLMTKILLVDIEDTELYNALQPFFRIVKDEKDREKREAVIDKMASLIHKNMPYVPIEHHRHFVVVSPEIKELLKD